jgi:hypothetical protein
MNFMKTLTKSEIKTLNLRIQTMSKEHAECTTEAQRKCVAESIAIARTKLEQGHW